eukprot:1158843-Pelagomonas_calceolata.AAC.6
MSYGSGARQLVSRRTYGCALMCACLIVHLQDSQGAELRLWGTPACALVFWMHQKGCLKESTCEACKVQHVRTLWPWGAPARVWSFECAQ